MIPILEYVSNNLMDYQSFLEDEFERRLMNNEKYSLRAFARDLSMSSSQLSEVLNKKRGISPTKAVQIAKVLKFNDFDSKYFIELVSASHARSKAVRKKSMSEVTSRNQLLNRKVISRKHFPMVNWLGFAIRRLSEHHDFKPDAQWIADRFGVTASEVEPRLNYLIENKLIIKKNGKWGIGDNIVFNSGDKSSTEAMLDFHRQALVEIKKAVSAQDKDSKDIAAHVFSLNRSQVKKIKELIRNFEDQLDKVTYETGEAPEDVYYFSSFLFPLTKKRNK